MTTEGGLPERAEEHGSAAGAGGAAEPAEHYLVARVDQLWLALPVEHVLEVAPYQPPTPVPLAPAHIPGLAKHRGQALALIDLQVFLGLGREAREQQPPDEGLRNIVVVTAGGMRVGIPCHQVRGVVESGQEPLGDAIQGERLRALCPAQLPGSLVVVIDVQRLLSSAKVSA